MPGKDTQFTSMHYIVCHYCEYQAIGFNRKAGEAHYGCSLQETKEGRYRKIAPMHTGHDIDGNKGCGRFEPSGMPAHPSVIDTLVRNNSRAKGITFNGKAAKTEKAFLTEMRKYPHVDCDFGLRKGFIKAVE